MIKDDVRGGGGPARYYESFGNEIFTLVRVGIASY